MLRRMSLIAAVLFILSIGLAACGGSESAPAATPLAEPTVEPAAVPAVTETPAPAASVTEPTVTSMPEQLSATQTLSVAINAEFKPFVYVDESGKLAGFDIDLLNAIGEVADVEIGFTNTNFADLLAGVAGGRYDAAISAITVTPERSRTVAFTDPYFTSGQAPVSFFSAGQGLAVRSGNAAITGTASLTTETKVGVKAATTGAEFVATQTPARSIEYPEAQEAFAALEQGEVDAIVIDSSIIADYIISHPGSIMMAGGPVSEEVYAIAVNPDRPEVLAMFNEALAELRANGNYQQLVNKWFGAP